MAYLIGTDIGTKGTKTALTDTQGTATGTSHRSKQRWPTDLTLGTPYTTGTTGVPEADLNHFYTQFN